MKLHFCFALYLAANDHRPEMLIAEITCLSCLKTQCSLDLHSTCQFALPAYSNTGHLVSLAASFREAGDGA